MASWMSMERNSAPSDEAPKLRTGSSRSVFPSFLFCIRPSLAPQRHGGHRGPFFVDPDKKSSLWSLCLCGDFLHSHARDEQQVCEALLVGGLDRQHVVGR